METKTYGSLIEVFRGSLWEAELVKGLLEISRSVSYAEG